MPAGRPRTSSPDPEECENLGEDLLLWAMKEDEHNPHIRFSQWYSLIKRMPRKNWKALVQVPEFLPYYEMAQSLLAGRVLNPKYLEKSFGHRYIRLYDRDLVECENEEVEFKAKANRKSEEELSKDETIRRLALALAEIEKNNEKST